MSHLVARASKVLLRRVEKKVADPGRVEARIVFDLRAEARLFVLFLEQRPPKGMKAKIDAPLDGSKLGVDLPQPSAHAIDAVLDAHSFGLGLGPRHAVRLALGSFESTREVFESCLMESKLVFQSIAEDLELLGVNEVFAARVVRQHFALELLNDHRRSPGAFFLAAKDVAVDVIPDVENLVARSAESLLEVSQVAAFVDLASLEGERGGPKRLSGSLHERSLLLEEGRLRGADDHDVEVVAPMGVLSHLPVEQVRHHLFCVGPARIGEEKQLLARAPQLVERGGEIGIFIHEARKIAQDRVENRSVPMRLVDTLADVGEGTCIVDGEPALLQGGDERRVERGLTQRVERINPVKPGGGGANLLRVVKLTKLRGCELS